MCTSADFDRSTTGSASIAVEIVAFNLLLVFKKSSGEE
jgi:hypothetical protein